MGSTAADHMTASEAAKTLGITLPTLQSMVRRGMIQPIYNEKKVRGASLFRCTDVAALADVLGQDLDMPAVASLAVRALSISRRNERRLEQIANLLGLDNPALGTTEQEVTSLHIAAQDLLEQLDVAPEVDIHHWAAVFYAIDEEYLRLIRHYTLSETPWEPYLALAQAMYLQTPKEELAIRKDLAQDYAFLEVARRHLRAVAYFYLRMQKGSEVADASFAEMQKQPIEAQLMQIIYRN